MSVTTTTAVIATMNAGAHNECSTELTQEGAMFILAVIGLASVIGIAYVVYRKFRYNDDTVGEYFLYWTVVTLAALLAICVILSLVCLVFIALGY